MTQILEGCWLRFKLKIVRNSGGVEATVCSCQCSQEITTINIISLTNPVDKFNSKVITKVEFTHTHGFNHPIQVVACCLWEKGGCNVIQICDWAQQGCCCYHISHMCLSEGCHPNNSALQKSPQKITNLSMYPPLSDTGHAPSSLCTHPHQTVVMHLHMGYQHLGFQEEMFF